MRTLVLECFIRYNNNLNSIIYIWGEKHEQNRINQKRSTKCWDFSKEATVVVQTVVESITNTLAAGEKVQLIGFGTFEVRERAARTGRNPQTGEEMQIAASKVPAFKAGKELKEAVK